jgi:tetratricopeptide (TPR) repeat protein
MDPIVIAAIIGAVGTIIAALITVWVTKRGPSVDSDRASTSQQVRNEAPNAGQSSERLAEHTQQARPEPADLSAAATIKRAHELELGTDVVIAGFRSDKYVEREVDREARAALERCGGIVIVGRPKSGKTRLAWQLLQERPTSLVVIPRTSQPPETFESNGLVGNDLVLFFDDLHRTAEAMKLLLWRRRLEEVFERPCRVISTSCDGRDWRLVRATQKSLLDTLGPDAIVFVSRTFVQNQERGEDLSFDEGLQLAQDVGLSTEEFSRRFDGTPGSLLVPDLEDMHRRYKALRDELYGEVSMSSLLDSTKLLDKAHQPRFHVPILRAVIKEIWGDGRMSREAWDAVRQRTREEGFGTFRHDEDGQYFETYQPYLGQCVDYEPSEEDVDQLVSVLSQECDWEGLTYLASYYFDEKNINQALTCVDQAAITFVRKEEGSDPKVSLLVMSKKAALSANSLLMGHNEEIVDALDESLSLEPNDPEAWNHKGVALDILHRHQEALVAFDRATRLRHDFAEAWWNKGLTLAHLERMEESVEALEEANRLDEASHSS